MLEGGHSRQAQGFLQFLHQLPAVERVQEIDVSGTAGKDRDGQLAAVFHVDLRGFLVGVAAVLQFELFHGVISFSFILAL